MDHKALLDGLVTYLCFLPILTFHEFAHAWVAWKCGDDTARLRGRVTLNPAAHIEVLGTIVLPLIALFLSASGSQAGRFIIGWGKPVPVNPSNLRNRRRDDTLIALAGPAMNVALAFVVLGLAKIGVLAQSPILAEMSWKLAVISLYLCFFNLLPVPPLDGSHVVKNALGMKEETYWRLCQFGFIAVILVIQIPAVRILLAGATNITLGLMATVLGLR